MQRVDPSIIDNFLKNLILPLRFFLGLDFEISNLGFRGLENVSKKKVLQKKYIIFRKFYECSKKFRRKKSISN